MARGKSSFSTDSSSRAAVLSVPPASPAASSKKAYARWKGDTHSVKVGPRVKWDPTGTLKGERVVRSRSGKEAVSAHLQAAVALRHLQEARGHVRLCPKIGKRRVHHLGGTRLANVVRRSQRAGGAARSARRGRTRR